MHTYRVVQNYYSCTRFHYFNSGLNRTWLYLGTEIRPEQGWSPKELVFATLNNTPDETNGVNNAVSYSSVSSWIYKIAITLQPVCRSTVMFGSRVGFPTELRFLLVYCGTAVPFFHGTSTVAFTVLFSTAIPQVPRFFDTVLVRYSHTVTKTALYFD